MDNLIKVIKIQEKVNRHNIPLKLVTFQEYRVNGVKVTAGKFGDRLLFSGRQNIHVQDLVTGNISITTWKADPLFKKVKINVLAAGKIVTYKTLEGGEFSCAVFNTEPYEIKAAAKQLRYQGKGSKLIGNNGSIHEHITSTIIIDDVETQNSENIGNDNLREDLIKRIPKKRQTIDIRSIEEAHAKAFIAKRKEDEKRLYEERKRREDSFWNYKKIIAWIIILIFLFLMFWFFSLGI